MKYTIMIRKNKTIRQIQQDKKYSHQQLCWICKKCCGGCSWSSDGVPVDGWTATPSYIEDNGIHAATYHITECPEFIYYKEDIIK